jgi:hypothetical protein
MKPLFLLLVVVLGQLQATNCCASPFTWLKSPSGVYTTKWHVELSQWASMDFDFRDDATVLVTKTEWLEPATAQNRITLKQESYGGRWTSSRGSVKVSLGVGGGTLEYSLRFQGDDLVGDKSLGERRYLKVK